ncbi:MAG TPA: TonB-dependent receptor [Gemmatimonadaceae bacterium]|nr:TonB-dependent receptor [Gemmatimonadaceae bacterium]
MNKLTTFPLVACIVAISATSARAQDSVATLNTVVISASKSPIDRARLTQSATVLTGDDLRARGITQVSEALRSVPGLSLAQNGSFGSVTSLFLRGGESRYTKVLIDGVAVNQSGGYFDFSHLTTDNIERIEIVRGPASVLYGADAMTGVIQIFTRRGSGPLTLDASARGGTYGTREADLALSGSARSLTYSLGGAQHHTDGLFDFNNDYNNGTLSGSIGFAPKRSTTGRVSARYTNAEFHYPTDFTGAPVDTNSYRVQHRLTVGADVGTAIAKIAHVQLLAGANEVSDLTEDIAFPFASTTQRHSADKSRGYRRSVEGRVKFVSEESANLNLGGELVWEGEKTNSASGAVGAPTTTTSRFDAGRSTRSVYAELLGSPQRLVAYTAAVRLDDNSEYGSHTTYRLGASVPVASDIRVRGSLSTAFNAPAFNQVRATLFTRASPNLSPERTRSWEAGIEQQLDNHYGQVSIVYFHQRFQDLIQYVSGGPPTYLGSYANLTEAKSDGYEAEVELTPPGKISATASVTQATPRVTRVSPSYTGDLKPGDALLRRPTHSGSAILRFAPKGGSASITTTYVGERPDLDFNQFPSPTVTLPAYRLVDLAGAVDVWHSAGRSTLSLTARVDNVLDKEYETVLHFPAPGRTLLIGARLSGSL